MKTILSILTIALFAGCGSTVEFGYADKAHGSFHGSYTAPANFSK
jgi:hypothetical protein